MKLSSFLAAKAIISLAFGFGFVAIPAAVWSMYGVTLDPIGILMTRFLAACLIGIGIICWITRNSDFNTLKGITLSLFIGDTIGFIVALSGQLSGLMNTLGWIIVAIWFLLAFGLGYFRFLKPSTS
jgi:hypothetical protein